MLKTPPILAAAFFLLAACSPPGEMDYPSAPPAETVTIERTICFGFCPAYSAGVSADDRLVFVGKSYVTETGEREKQLPEGSFDRLLTIAEKHRFSAFDEFYPNMAGDNCPNVATDMPTVTVAIDSSHLAHSVKFYEGCFDFEGRERLEAMIEEMDAVLALDDWIGDREDFYGEL